MIVGMKKVTLLCMEQDRAATLDALGKAGVIHLEHVRQPEGRELDKARADLDRAKSAQSILQSQPENKGSASAGIDGMSGAELVERVHELVALKRATVSALESARKEQTALRPFGDFDPRLIMNLRDAGVMVRLFHVRPKDAFEPPESASVFTLHSDSSGRYIAVVGAGEEFSVPADEFPLPERSLSELAESIARSETELNRIESELGALVPATKRMAGHIAALETRLRYIEAHEGMGADGEIVYLRGFCPEDAAARIETMAARRGWGLLMEDPGPGDDVPTLIRHPRWARPIECLLKFIKILPGYREIDISASFLIFLSVFFAMIVGDAGYGAIYLGLTLWARGKFRKAPAGPFRLMTIFSVCTIAWGALTGTWFGIADLPAPMKALKVDWLTERGNVMDLCLYLAAVHLTIAHAWNGIRIINTLQALAQAGWIAMTWCLLYIIKALFTGAGTPMPAVIGAGASSVVILVFMTPFRQFRKDWISNAMFPLSVMSTFGDILSYLRLFALGVASLEVARSFNTMASMVGFGNVLKAGGAAFILLFGHTLNIVLAALSVLVHGIRLNALEFSMHLGLEWSGREFRPFEASRNGATNDD